MVVVGLGRVGGAIASGLLRAGWPVCALPRSDESARRAKKLRLPLADRPSLLRARLCLLAVPDRVVGQAAAKVHAKLPPGAALVHCAGALDLSAFGREPDLLRRPRGSFHPLCAVSARTDNLSGHAVALAASEPSLSSLLRKMARSLGLRPLEVPEARRACYHAGAVMGAGLLVALASAAQSAFMAAGISEEEALSALLPLMRSALRGVEQRGPSRGLTGPIPRGDLSVVKAHLSALPPELLGIYRALSLRALALSQRQLPLETRGALAEVLEG